MNPNSGNDPSPPLVDDEAAPHPLAAPTPEPMCSGGHPGRDRRADRRSPADAPPKEPHERRPVQNPKQTAHFRSATRSPCCRWIRPASGNERRKLFINRSLRQTERKLGPGPLWWNAECTPPQHEADALRLQGTGSCFRRAAGLRPDRSESTGCILLRDLTEKKGPDCDFFPAASVA